MTTYGKVPKAPVHQTLTPRSGAACYVAANVVFGLSPLYWNLLTGVPAFEVVCHRTVWAAVILVVLNACAGGMGPFYEAARNKTVLLFIGLCALVHLCNWWFYIWAVTSGHVLEASLGQYFAPMCSTLLGLVIFGERPRRLQAVALLLAASGVVIQTVSYGRLPWISLVLGLTVAIFPVLRKYADVDAIPGMLLEMLFLFPFVGGYLFYLWFNGGGAFLRGGLMGDTLLLGAGVMTAVPQLLLNAGVRSVPMIPISIMQYILPTIVFLLGVFIYDERFGPVELFVFGCIWAGIIVYLYDLLRVYARRADQRG